MYFLKKDPGGSVYVSVYDSTIASTSLTSMFRLKAGSNTRVTIEEVHVGRAGGGANSFGIYLYRGSTTALSTTYNVTPTPIGGWTGYPAAASQVNVGSTVLPSTASAVLLDADTSDGYRYTFDGWGDLELVPGQVFDVVGKYLQVASSDADIHGVLRFRETGKNPIS